MESQRFESATHIAVIEGERFAGIIRIEDLLAAAAAQPVRSIMDASPPFVGPGVDKEVAAWQAVRRGESALAVVDENRRFVGFIPPDRLLAVLLWEHDEDIARLGGYLHDTESARTATIEPVRRRLWHRIPWLLLGLAGALLAANVMGAFEETLRRDVTLAFFVPGIVYLADAVGTQTEALVIRGLSVGVSVRQLVFRELVTGLLIGAALGAVFLPFGLVGWGEPDIAIAVGLSLFAASSIATVIAMALPWLIHRAGGDPAYGSGPLATVAQDLLSIFIYLSVATALVD
jgi:magnesium transporter